MSKLDKSRIRNPLVQPENISAIFSMDDVLKLVKLISANWIHPLNNLLVLVINEEFKWDKST